MGRLFFFCRGEVVGSQALVKAPWFEMWSKYVITKVGLQEARYNQNTFLYVKNHKILNQKQIILLWKTRYNERCSEWEILQNNYVPKFSF